MDKEIMKSIDLHKYLDIMRAVIFMDALFKSAFATPHYQYFIEQAHSKMRIDIEACTCKQPRSSTATEEKECLDRFVKKNIEIIEKAKEGGACSSCGLCPLFNMQSVIEAYKLFERDLTETYTYLPSKMAVRWLQGVDSLYKEKTASIPDEKTRYNQMEQEIHDDMKNNGECTCAEDQEDTFPCYKRYCALQMERVSEFLKHEQSKESQ